MTDKRAAFKALSSFAMVALCAIAMYRLAVTAGPFSSSRIVFAFGVIAILMIAAAWRGVLYLRYLRTGAKP